METPTRTAFQLGMNILCQHLRLTKCELGRRRARLAVFRVADRCTVAERPEVSVTLHSKCAIHDDSAAPVPFNGQRLQQWIRRGASGPYECGRAELAVAQNDNARLRIREPAIQAEADATLFHFFLSIAGEGLAQLRQDAVARMPQPDAQPP